MGKRVVSIILLILVVVTSTLVMISFFTKNFDKGLQQQIIFLNILSYLGVAIFLLSNKRRR